MKSYRDEAIVLRTHKLGEADRIITLLTAEHGQVRAVAKGVRKTTSKFGARVEPFSVIDAQLHRGRTLDTLTQVASIAQYGDAIAANYDLYLAATVVVETAERLTADAYDGTHSQYLLLLGALNALARGRHDPTLIRTSYTLRALALAGWAPRASTVPCAELRDPTPRSLSLTAAPSAIPAVRPVPPLLRPTRWPSSASCSAVTGSGPTDVNPMRAPRPRALSPRTLNGIWNVACAR